MANRAITRFPTLLLVGGLMLAGFAAGLGLVLLKKSGQFIPEQGRVSDDVGGPSTPSVRMGPSVKSPGSPELRASSIGVSDTGSTEWRLESSFAATGSSDSSSRSGNVLQDQGSRSGSSSATETNEEDPNAVIGRKFPISTSIEAMCRKLSSKDEDRCEVTHRKLSEFTQQPRDTGWASNMEAQLRDLVMSQPGYTIRAIECRTSLCVAEVASLYGMFHFVTAIGTDSPLHQNMMNGLEWQTAYEHDLTSGTVTVTLMMFERRQ